MRGKSTADIMKEIDSQKLISEARMKALEEAFRNDETSLEEEDDFETMAERFGLVASELKAPIAHEGYNYLRNGILAMADSKNNLETAKDMYEYVASVTGVDKEVVKNEIVKLTLVVQHFMTGTPSIVHKENREAFERYFDGNQAYIINDAEFIRCILKAVKGN